MSDVFRALADESRRSLLDALFARNGQSLSEMAENMPMSRQAVAKHLAILESANLVSTAWRGREKLHYLNPVPIGEIVRRWVGKFEDARVDALTDFKEQMETSEEKRRA
ncbi:MAG: winged helix-turn-helix transcriptional regulator [Euryhalocaulis sp.]|uniref:ArsR/SmtB family transcription factor n=1 Tax=Euryhalocaulis sp. TaxID=2744307 RepID=UPI0017B5D683|nr:metalloregulator ArsR/SmtB family transcription factor [Euryhalocaulis sp.]MBA4802965.1 winged helix-turn-helix transcriptional regulator [Euryhalocaulis sp.]